MNKFFSGGTKFILGAFLFFFSQLGFSSEPWFEAARTGDEKMMEDILRKNPELLNAQNEKGYTALVLSSYHEQRRYMQELLRRGADACITDKKGNSALMGVIFKGYREIISDLLAKCDVDLQNHEGQTALMYAALFGREEVAKDLLSRGAKKDLMDHEGRTAQGLAQGQWNQAMVSVLKTFKIINR
jgi:uncharacterized protein